MRKNNWIVLGLLAIAVAFLLWLWYFLSFDQVDNPYDLTLAIVAWVLIIVAGVIFYFTEKRRREKLRTVYVNDLFLYNPQAGLVSRGTFEAPAASAGQGVPEVAALVEQIRAVLDGLDYSYDLKKLDEKQMPVFRTIIRTSKFKDGGNEWEGEVAPASDPDNAVPFSSQKDLEALLASMA